MWSRHRPDISLQDIAFAARYLLGGSPATATAIAKDWFPHHEAVVCLSVRSGFDLLLQAMRLRADDEILFTEVTISGMVRVAETAGARVRSVPVDRATLAPSPAALVERLTARTRAVVLAPLFGSRYPIGALARAARLRGAIVIEDAAQAFTGREFPGSPEADVSMFSFGMIKRASAAGGAVLRVRDPKLRAAMLKRLAAYPLQTRGDYSRRLAMLALLRVASHRRLYKAVHLLLGLLGEPDRLVASMGKTRKAQQSIEKLRRRPCDALTRLLERRVQQRWRLPPMVAPTTLDALAEAACGSEAATRPNWVLPVALDQPNETAARLRRLGYDASTLSSLLRIANDKQHRIVNGDEEQTHWLARTLFLPTDEKMPAADRQRMIDEVLAAKRSATPRCR